MTVISKPEKSIINLLKKGEALSFDELYCLLSVKEKFTEREVKETIWKLLEEQKIAPNKQWKMKLK